MKDDSNNVSRGRSVKINGGNSEFEMNTDVTHTIIGKNVADKFF